MRSELVHLVADVVSPDIRGSRPELERSTARRLELALVLVFAAARAVHVGQAVIDLTVARSAYHHFWVAAFAGGACLAESTWLIHRFLKARRLSSIGMVVDALFGLTMLAVLSVATTGDAGRAADLNWMLQYTVATAAGLGLVAPGPLLDSARPAGWRRVTPAAMVVALMVGYVVSVSLPRLAAGEAASEVLLDAVNYPVFFGAGYAAVAFARHVLSELTRRSADVTAASAAVAQQAQWRALTVDVFGPVGELFDEVLSCRGRFSKEVRDEAGRLMELIESVRPSDTAWSAVTPGRDGASRPEQ